MPTSPAAAEVSAFIVEDKENVLDNGEPEVSDDSSDSGNESACAIPQKRPRTKATAKTLGKKNKKSVRDDGEPEVSDDSSDSANESACAIPQKRPRAKATAKTLGKKNKKSVRDDGEPEVSDDSSDSANKRACAIPQKPPRAKVTVKPVGKKAKHGSPVPSKRPSRCDAAQSVWSDVQESPIAKVRDSISQKNRRKLLDLSLNTTVSIGGYKKKSARAKRRPSVSGDFTDMFGHFLKRFKVPTLKSKAPTRRTAASRRRNGMRHSRRFRRR